MTGSAGAQRCDFGYELITWDLWGRPLPDAYTFLAGMGFQWVEALVGNSLGTDTARRYMPLPGVGTPPHMSDTDMLVRLALLQQAEDVPPLRIGALFVNATYVDESVWPNERGVFQAVARFLKGCGGDVLVCGGGPPERVVHHSPEIYRTFAKALAEVGEHAGELGLKTVYHPHLDFFVETREQLDRLMDVLDTSSVGLCIDPAHLQLAGSDPVDALRTYIRHVKHVHLKDFAGDPTSLEGWDRYSAFRPLGAGGVDLAAFVQALLDAYYDGLVVIELDISEQPEEDCRTSVKYVTETLGLRLNASGDKAAASRS